MKQPLFTSHKTTGEICKDTVDILENDPFKYVEVASKADIIEGEKYVEALLKSQELTPDPIQIPHIPAKEYVSISKCMTESLKEYESYVEQQVFNYALSLLDGKDAEFKLDFLKRVVNKLG